jgi:hypothetical protein
MEASVPQEDEVPMKNGKKPTREQRKLLQKWKLDTYSWLVVKDTPTEMVLVHRHFDKTKKIIPKGVKEFG